MSSKSSSPCCASAMLPICRARRTKRACLISGAGLLFLPPYSPGLKPIEMAFANRKELLRQAQATAAAPSGSHRATLNMSTPEERANYVPHCGYNPL